MSEPPASPWLVSDRGMVGVSHTANRGQLLSRLTGTAPACVRPVCCKHLSPTQLLPTTPPMRSRSGASEDQTGVCRKIPRQVELQQGRWTCAWFGYWSESEASDVVGRILGFIGRNPGRTHSLYSTALPPSLPPSVRKDSQQKAEKGLLYIPWATIGQWGAESHLARWIGRLVCLQARFTVGVASTAQPK